ncbi:MAG: tRNA pseudouridine(38-40) synthase TruA [Polyangia bacterium]
MRRIRLVVEYDGTDFHGWQRQDNGTSIQAELERAIDALTHEGNTVRGAGRTDAGVHASGQVAHFDTERDISLRGFRLGVNTHLPRTICVRCIDEVPEQFDARFSADGKLYRYTIWNDLGRSSLRDRFAWHCKKPLDEHAMQASATLLVGRHDFAAFRAADCERQTTVRTLHRVDVRRDGNVVTIEVEGDAFLKNMVRILSGTLVYAGEGRFPPGHIVAIRDALDRKRAGITAPAHGLCLVRVDYSADFTRSRR